MDEASLDPEGRQIGALSPNLFPKIVDLLQGAQMQKKNSARSLHLWVAAAVGYATD
jgi:hypothetical protein